MCFENYKVSRLNFILVKIIINLKGRNVDFSIYDFNFFKKDKDTWKLMSFNVKTKGFVKKTIKKP